MGLLAVVGEGDYTLTGSYYEVCNDTRGGHYVLKLDLTNLAASETAYVQVKTQLRSAGSFTTLQQEALYSWTDAQDDSTLAKSKVKSIGPISADVKISVWLKQSGGSYRAVGWKLLKA